MQNYLQHFNKNSSTAVPSRNERYEEIWEYANLFAIFRKGSPKSYARMGSIAVPLRNQRGEELFILANCQKMGTIIAMLCTSQ